MIYFALWGSPIEDNRPCYTFWKTLYTANIPTFDRMSLFWTV